MLVCPAFCAVVPAGSAISASGGAFAAGGPSRTGVEQEREEILHPRALVLAVGNFRPIAEKALSNAEDSCSDARPDRRLAPVRFSISSRRRPDAPRPDRPKSRRGFLGL